MKRTSLAALAFVLMVVPSAYALDAHGAQGRWEAYLASRHGFAHARQRWSKCPRVEVIKGYDGRAPFAICMAEWKHAGVWHYVNGRVLEPSHGRLHATIDFRRSYRRHWRSCHIPKSQRRYVPGKLSTDWACDPLMASDIEYMLDAGKRVKAVYMHGTNLAGFGKFARFACKQRGRAVRCHNGLGDAFKYRG